MKPNLLKSIFLYATFFVATNLSAYDFSVENSDGVTIYYNIISETDKTCKVTYQRDDSYNNTSYSGKVIIPSQVNYNSVQYSVTSIGEWAFIHCSGMTSIEIPNSVTSIGYYAFGVCTGLTSIEIPNSVTSIGSDAFYGCTGLTSVKIPNSVTLIESSAFSDCTGLTSIEIPNSVTIIGSHAFSGCIGLTSIEIPNSVISIGREAFNSCSGLTSIEIPNTITSIGIQEFYGCTSLASIKIPNSVTSIGSNAFGYCTGLTSIEIPNSVTSIGSDAFYQCSNVEYLNYNAKVKLDQSLIPYGSSLKEVVIGDDVPEMGGFGGCNNLKTVSIGNSITSIGGGAFNNCSRLNSIIIGVSVSSIGGNAFYGCTNLERVDINDLEAWFKISFDDECANPLYYGHYLNLNNQELHDIVIPNTITTINPFVLYNATCLTSIEIPNSVTSIGEKAFYGCSNLTSVKSNITNVFKTGASAFEGCDKATLYVPEGLLISYSGREDWSRIAKIEESESGIKIAMSCNSRGKVIINDETIFTKKMGEVKVLEDVDNTFEFVPNANCKLEQVLVNGLDVTASVENNKLISPIDEGASMIVTFSKDEADVNHDGAVNINDVVALVNIILVR